MHAVATASLLALGIASIAAGAFILGRTSLLVWRSRTDRWTWRHRAGLGLALGEGTVFLAIGTFAFIAFADSASAWRYGVAIGALFLLRDLRHNRFARAISRREQTMEGQ